MHYQRQKKNAQPKLIHFGTGTPTYRSWMSMKTRCLNPRSSNWPKYGGRGITICDRWLHFPNFLADMGERPEGTTLDRIDVDGNYEPKNCRWATPQQQTDNRRVAVYFEQEGQRLTINQWSRLLGIPRATLYDRYKRGLSVEDILRR